jgi:uncharacterized membrane protein
MFYSILKLVHLLAILLWVGGMIFAHCFLRPAVAVLEPAQRLRLMRDVLSRFLNAVLGAVVLTLGTGLWMIGRTAKEISAAGGHFAMPHAWMTMLVLGLVMMAIFGHIRFASYPRLNRAVQAEQWMAAGKAVKSIKTLVTINLALGLLTIAVITLG